MATNEPRPGMTFTVTDSDANTIRVYGSALEAKIAADNANRANVAVGLWPTATAYVWQGGYRIELGDLT